MEWKKSFYLFKTELIIGHKNGTSFPLASIHSPIQHIFRRNSFHLLDIPEVIVSILYKEETENEKKQHVPDDTDNVQGRSRDRTHASANARLTLHHSLPPTRRLCIHPLSAEMLHKVKLPLVE